MDSANHQWLQELENDDVGELEFINPMSMQKLADSLANELWGQPPPQQQEQQDNQGEQCAYLNPSLTGSHFLGDTNNINKTTISAGVSKNMFPFTDASTGSVNFQATEYRRVSVSSTTMAKCGSPSTIARGGARRSTSSVQEHAIAERKRREKMYHQFVTLKTIIPDITKTDKVSLLGSTIEYVQKLRDRLKALQDELQTTGNNSEESPVLDAYCCTDNSKRNDYGDEVTSPKIEVDMQGTTVLLRVLCRKKKGVLLMVLKELEKDHLSVVDTNVVPFAGSSLNITITAQMEDGRSTATKLVEALNLALRNM